jgi:D-alanyl-D-alanine carboxypeptidase
MHRLLACAALAILLAIPAPGLAASTTQADRALDRALRKLVSAKGGPPGAASVIQRGSQLRLHRAGVADVRSKARIKLDDSMRLASTSKAFSGAVALSLVEKGVLSLDDTIAMRLPDQPPAWGAVTLREALQHTSGLPDYTGNREYQDVVTADPRGVVLPHAKLLTYVAGEPLDFPSGSAYHYSNSDNVIVALMAEAATGRPYDQLLTSEVYDRLGMTETSLPEDFRLPRPYVHGYDVEPGTPPDDISTLLSASGAWASGGIVSTPRDATSFVRGYVGRKLFGRPTQDEQFKLVDGASEPAGPGKNRAGLAIFRYDTRCGTVYGHTGNFPGYTQLMAATLDGRRSVTFTINEALNKEMSAPKRRLLAQLRRAETVAVCAALAG